MSRSRWFRYLASVAILGTLLVASNIRAHAQGAAAGSLSGTVSDATGSVISNAHVIVTNVGTRQVRSVSTSDGYYSVEALPAGNYDIQITAAGFKTYSVRGLKLDTGERAAVNATLEIGTADTEVTVEGTATRVETEAGESGAVIGETQIQGLQLNGRNFMQLGMLVPGVSSAVGAQEVGGGGNSTYNTLSMNGMGIDNVSYFLDGAYNMQNGSNMIVNVTPPMDTVSEFRIAKDNYSAKYGFTGSGVVQVETRSGTQGFHGSAYEYLRNDAFDASNYFAARDENGDTIKTPLKQNIFGFSFSGPLFIPGKYNTNKQKTFFFVNEEWRRRRVGLTLRGAMLPQAMREGDFSSSPTLAGGAFNFDAIAQQTLADKYPGIDCAPDSTHLNPQCFDSNAVALMNRYWPLPNNPSGGFLNYINPGSEAVNQRTDTYRVDHLLTSKINLTGRVTYMTVSDRPPYNSWGPNPAPTIKNSLDYTALNALLRVTATISSNTINQFSLTETYNKPRYRLYDAELTPDININYVYQNADVHNRVPQIYMGGGWASLGAFPLPIDASDNSFLISNDFTTVKGKHTLQLGGIYVFGRSRQNLYAQTNGTFQFTGLHTGDPAADFLLGLNAASVQESTERFATWRYPQFDLYFQDDWKVARNLTLNLGIRQSYYAADRMEGDAFSDFDPSLWNAANAPAVQANGLFVTNAQGQTLTADGRIADTLNGIVQANGQGIPQGIFTTPKLNVGPRIGFAWDIFGDGKTSLRGGYGIGYFRIPGAFFLNLSNPPYVSSITLINGTLTDPAGGVQAPVGPAGLAVLGPPGGESRPSYNQTWSLTLQREIVPNAVFTLGYAGSGARFLKSSRDLNAPIPMSAPSLDNPACLQPGQTIPADGFDFDPCINAGLVSANYTRPYTGWGAMSTGRGLNGASAYNGTSNYHSLQSGFQLTAFKGLTLTAAYTWSKALSDVASRGGQGGVNQTGSAQNARNYDAEYGPVGWDRPHVFTSSYVYQLPFFKNRAGFLGNAFGRWVFSGITVIESGVPYSVAITGANLGLVSRPDCVGSVEGPRTLNRWFNTDAFRSPAWGFYGTCGTGTIRGPSENSWSWSLAKHFKINESTQLQFRAQGFNVLNHPNFNGVDVSYGSPNFGKVTSALDPRIMEFALRLDF